MEDLKLNMSRLTLQQRILIVEDMIKTNAASQTARNMNKNFKFKVTRQTVSKLFNKWKHEGSVKDLHIGNSGRPRSARNGLNKEKVQEFVRSHPQMSVTKIAAACGLTKPSVYRILKRDLQMKPYKPMVSQELKVGDDIKRLAFCKHIEELAESGELNPDDIIFSDESHIYLTTSPNKQNNRVWSPNKPDQRNHIPLHSAKVTVWCGLNATKIIGPYFYEDPASGSATTVTKERYVAMLEELFPRRSINVTNNTVFMQDGAPAHTSRIAMDWLEKRFHGKVISNKSNFIWPPRSPDLNPLDFFLWGFMKQKVHEGKPKSISELKQLIENFIASVSQETLQRVISQFRSRVKKCIAAKGELFE